MKRENLLIRLHRLASSQDENFITESLAYLLRHLLRYESDASISILHSITCGKIHISKQELSGVDITTQVSTESGKPDISIQTTRHLFYIEAKIDSEFGHMQLERYRNELNKCKSKETYLITLTRFPFISNEKVRPDFYFRWHNIYDWLKKLEVQSEISEFLIDQFLTLLKLRGISMDQVSWELVPGIHSMGSLLDMLAEALAATNVSIYSKSGAWNWHGYYIEDKKFFIGIYLDTPHLVVINTEMPLSVDVPQEATIGRIQDSEWRNELDLASENVHFFARTKASQIQCLEIFIKESLPYGKTLID